MKNLNTAKENENEFSSEVSKSNVISALQIGKNEINSVKNKKNKKSGLKKESNLIQTKTETATATALALELEMKAKLEKEKKAYEVERANSLAEMIF